MPVSAPPLIDFFSLLCYNSGVYYEEAQGGTYHAENNIRRAYAGVTVSASTLRPVHIHDAGACGSGVPDSAALSARGSFSSCQSDRFLCADSTVRSPAADAVHSDDRMHGPAYRRGAAICAENGERSRQEIC